MSHQSAQYAFIMGILILLMILKDFTMFEMFDMYVYNRFAKDVIKLDELDISPSGRIHSLVASSFYHKKKVIYENLKNVKISNSIFVPMDTIHVELFLAYDKHTNLSQRDLHLFDVVSVKIKSHLSKYSKIFSTIHIKKRLADNIDLRDLLMLPVGKLNTHVDILNEVAGRLTDHLSQIKGTCLRCTLMTLVGNSNVA